MKGLAITNKGLEDIACLEIQEILHVEATAKEYCVIFPIKNLHDLYTLAYRAQSLVRVMLLCDEFDTENIEEDIGAHMKSVDHNSLVEPYTIVCTRYGDHTYNSQDVVHAAKKTILGKTFSYKDYKSMIDILVVNDHVYVGLDVAGFDLSKRSYKIFNNAFSLKGTIAYGLVRLAGVKKNARIVDPFSRDGTISIEAALYARTQSPHYFDKRKFFFHEGFNFEPIDKLITPHETIFAIDDSFQNISAAKKNAKIAEVQKDIQFRKHRAEDIDLVFEKDSVDAIISSPTPPKALKALLNAVPYILHAKSKVALLFTSPPDLELIAKETGFTILSKRTVLMGEQACTIVLLEKTKK